MLTPLYGALYPALQGNFYALSLVRFLVSFLLILIPTTLMGGTLPVLSKFVASGMSTLTERVGRLYAFNTLGAVAGVIGTSFFLLPRLGLRNTTWLCAAINLGILLAALGLARGDRNGSRSTDGTERRYHGVGVSSRKRRKRWRALITGIFALTGFCALSLEVVWMRILSLVIGTTVYAFAIMLTTFLLGLALGGTVFAGVAQRTRHPGRAISIVVISIGFAVLLSVIAIGRLPLLYMAFYEKVHPGWAGLTWFQFTVCSLIMLVPTFLMGALFPLVTRLYTTDLSRVGHEIGEIYSLNTLGAIAGSVAGSFPFLRYLGAVRSMIAIAAVYTAVGILLIVAVAEFRRRSMRVVAAGMTLSLAVLLIAARPMPDLKLMTSGVYRYAPLYKTVEGLRRTIRQTRTLFYNDGLDATVSVERFKDELTLSIDGKADASTGLGDMTTQVLLAQIPMLIHPNPETVLVIGLGCGVTLGSVQQHAVQSVDCVELLENVVEASAAFRSYNHDCLRDPRVNLIIGDGRNHLLLTQRKYDVIISEPTNPWISGVNDLFTGEFFEIAKRRLSSGGIMCAWFHAYHMSEADLFAMVRTFMSVYSEVTLWRTDGTDLIFLGSDAPPVFHSGSVKKMSDPAVAADLARVWVRTPAGLVSSHLSGTQCLRRLAGERGMLNTDDNMLLEFSAGARLLERMERDHLDKFAGMIEPQRLGEFDDRLVEEIRAHAEARSGALRASVELMDNRTSVAMSLLKKAYEAAPLDPYVINVYLEANLAVANALFDRADYEAAATGYQKVLIEPGHPAAWRAHLGLGLCCLTAHDYEQAYRHFRMSIDANPNNAEAYYNLARVNRFAGRIDEAISIYKQGLEIHPHAGAAHDLSRVYLEMGIRPDEALELAEMAASMHEGVLNYNTLGCAYHSAGDYVRARRALGRALELNEHSSEALYRLGLVELSAGRSPKAREYLGRSAGLKPQDRFTEEARKRLQALGPG